MLCDLQGKNLNQSYNVYEKIICPFQGSELLDLILTFASVENLQV